MGLCRYVLAQLAGSIAPGARPASPDRRADPLFGAV